MRTMSTAHYVNCTEHGIECNVDVGIVVVDDILYFLARDSNNNEISIFKFDCPSHCSPSLLTIIAHHRCSPSHIVVEYRRVVSLLLGIRIASLVNQIDMSSCSPSSAESSDSSSSSFTSSSSSSPVQSPGDQLNKQASELDDDDDASAVDALVHMDKGGRTESSVSYRIRNQATSTIMMQLTSSTEALCMADASYHAAMVAPALHLATAYIIDYHAQVLGLIEEDSTLSAHIESRQNKSSRSRHQQYIGIALEHAAKIKSRCK